MSCDQTARIGARLLEDRPLTSGDRRHVASCTACQRAADEAGRLDSRLRDATRPLAVEPIPSEVLDVAPMHSGPALSLAAGAGLGALAAVVVAALLVVGPLRGPIAIDPDPTNTPSTRESPSATAEPATPSSRPTPEPTAEPTAEVDRDVNPRLVGPLGTCADGTAGFSVFLPSGWYANRHVGDQPACRTIGPARLVDDRQILNPAIYLSVVDTAPTFDGATIEDEAERTLPNGVTLTRMTVRTPESGALAGSHEVVYLAPLPDGRLLMATTDAARPAWVAALDEVMEGLEVYEPIAIDTEAVEAAEALFADRDVCEDPDRGLAVIFPDAWWTNTAVEELPACSWFAPTSFEFAAADAVPGEVELTIEVIDSSYGTVYEIVALDSITVLDRPAGRWIIDTPQGRLYEYEVALGDPSSESGPTLVARTSAPEDLDLAMAVLDELMARITMADPPPGASSDQPYLAASPASAEATEADFRLELTVEQDRYRAGQPILADATLTYLGDGPVRLWGSGSALVGTTVRQLDGPIDPGMAFTTDCVAYEIDPDAPMHVEFGKSGGFDTDEPLADFYEAYFRDPLLRLPPGRWELVASASFTVGGDDCGAGPGVSVRATVEIVVEP